MFRFPLPLREVSRAKAGSRSTQKGRLPWKARCEAIIYVSNRVQFRTEVKAYGAVLGSYRNEPSKNEFNESS